MLRLFYPFIHRFLSSRLKARSWVWPGPSAVVRPPSLPPSNLCHLSSPLPPSLPPSLPPGKSTLLLAMLGELGVYDRSVVDIGNGPLAYASQEVGTEGGRAGGRDGGRVELNKHLERDWHLTIPPSLPPSLPPALDLDGVRPGQHSDGPAFHPRQVR